MHSLDVLLMLQSHGDPLDRDAAEELLDHLIVMAALDEGDVSAVAAPLFALYHALNDREEDTLSGRDADTELTELYRMEYLRRYCERTGQEFNRKVVDASYGNLPINDDLQAALCDHDIQVPRWFVIRWANCAAEVDAARLRQVQRMFIERSQLPGIDEIRQANSRGI